MKAIVGGMMATYPLGGVAWDYGQYLLALERLGFDVLYIEDTGTYAYDPRVRTYVEDCSYAIDYLPRTLQDLSPRLTRWAYRDAGGHCFGMSLTELENAFADADVFLNVSAATMLRDAYMACPRKCLIDTDPGANHFRAFPRMEVMGTWPGYHSYREHDFFFTYAARIREPGCRLPDLGLSWIVTRPPVMLDCWAAEPPGKTWTTVMSWGSYREPLVHDGVSYGGKEPEFARLEELPRRVKTRLEVAASGVEPPRARWRDLGWNVVDGEAISATAGSYRHYVQASRGEVSVAKNVYVATSSGWFSCRTVCYLAAGLPAIVQDTGFSTLVPCGEGLLAFSTLDEAVAAIARVEADYARHAARAKAIAREYFDAPRVVGDMLAHAGLQA